MKIFAFLKKKQVKQEPFNVGTPDNPVFDPHSGTWLWLKSELERRIESEVKDLKNPRFDVVRTALSRGLIEAYEEILQIEERSAQK